MAVPSLVNVDVSMIFYQLVDRDFGTAIQLGSLLMWFKGIHLRSTARKELFECLNGHLLKFTGWTSAFCTWGISVDMKRTDSL